jgi:hypothetical protein
MGLCVHRHAFTLQYKAIAVKRNISERNETCMVALVKGSTHSRVLAFIHHLAGSKDAGDKTVTEGEPARNLTG